ncbi:hypothetical protein ABZS53_15320 [Streptomyces sp. NPDC005499]|uniref:hypothetical protein n=1 Tax=Streptomyces sp. NPDC005499 TaxID=3154883 RepID=UPI0033B39AA1
MTTIVAAGPDENFWSAVAAVAAILTIPVAIWAAWTAQRAVWPRRQIRWSASVSSLVSHGAAHTNLGVTWLGSALSHPHIVQINLRNVGNKDLEPAHFSGRPIEILCSVPITAILEQESRPSVHRALEATNHGSRLEVDVSTPLHRKQELRYVVLVDGPDPDLRLRVSLTNGSTSRRHDLSLEELALQQRHPWQAVIMATVMVAVAAYLGRIR